MFWGAEQQLILGGRSLGQCTVQERNCKSRDAVSAAKVAHSLQYSLPSLRT